MKKALLLLLATVAVLSCGKYVYQDLGGRFNGDGLLD